MQRGDILIFGEKGQSAGAGGHTAIAISIDAEIFSRLICVSATGYTV